MLHHALTDHSALTFDREAVLFGAATHDINAQDLRDEDYGYAYEEDELAVLPAGAMLYIRTSRGVIALRE